MGTTSHSTYMLRKITPIGMRQNVSPHTHAQENYSNRHEAQRLTPHTCSGKSLHTHAQKITPIVTRHSIRNI
eukprot:1156874-Pelagomonas_calceolata.AAC.4